MDHAAKGTLRTRLAMLTVVVLCAGGACDDSLHPVERVIEETGYMDANRIHILSPQSPTDDRQSLAIVGQYGVLLDGSAVTVTNENTGEIISGQVEGNGSFAASLSAGLNDHIAVDAAGIEQSRVVLRVLAQPPFPALDPTHWSGTGLALEPGNTPDRLSITIQNVEELERENFTGVNVSTGTPFRIYPSGTERTVKASPFALPGETIWITYFTGYVTTDALVIATPQF